MITESRERDFDWNESRNFSVKKLLKTVVEVFLNEKHSWKVLKKKGCDSFSKK